jgi:hypothetical protein
MSLRMSRLFPRSHTEHAPVHRLDACPNRSLFRMPFVRDRFAGASCQRLAAIVLPIGVCLLLCLLSFEVFQVGTWWDDAYYVVSARALAAGHGYSLINYPDARAATVFPPGFPVLLVLSSLVMPDSFSALKVVSLLLTLAALPLWLCILRYRLPTEHASLVMLCAATNPLIVTFANLIMSEAAFFFFLACVLLVSEKVAASTTMAWRWSLLLTSLLVALYFLRTIGVVFAISTVLYLLLRRSTKSAIVVSIGWVLPALLWAWRNASYGGGILSPVYERELIAGYEKAPPINGLTDIIDRVVQSFYNYTTSIIPEALGLGASNTTMSDLAVIPGSTGLVFAISLASSLLVLLGLSACLRRSIRHTEIALGLYLSALLVWPWNWTKYLHPVLPLLYACLLVGLLAGGTVISQLMPRRTRLVGLARVVLIGLIAVNLVKDQKELQNPMRNRITDISIGATWIAANTPVHSVVMSPIPLQHALYAQRWTIDIPWSAGDGHLWSAVQQSDADYIIVAPPVLSQRTTTLDSAVQELAAMLDDHPASFPVVFLSPEHNVRVYHVARRPTGVSSTYGSMASKEMR